MLAQLTGCVRNARDVVAMIFPLRSARAHRLDPARDLCVIQRRGARDPPPLEAHRSIGDCRAPLPRCSRHVLRSPVRCTTRAGCRDSKRRGRAFPWRVFLSGKGFPVFQLSRRSLNRANRTSGRGSRLLHRPLSRAQIFGEQPSQRHSVCPRGRNAHRDVPSVGLERIEQPQPFSGLRPTIESTKHGLPRPKRIRQIPPRNTRASPPQHGFDEARVIDARPSCTAMVAKKQPDFLPLPFVQLHP